jgi:hypothetical protein
MSSFRVSACLSLVKVVKRFEDFILWFVIGIYCIYHGMKSLSYCILSKSNLQFLSLKYFKFSLLYTLDYKILIYIEMLIVIGMITSILIKFNEFYHSKANKFSFL